MTIIFDTLEEYEKFQDEVCPSDLGIGPSYCIGECDKCYEDHGIKLVKGYEQEGETE